MIDRSVFLAFGEEPWVSRLTAQLVEDDATGCWNWVGATNDHQRGYIAIEGRVVGAHRVAFEFANGPVFCFLDIDHFECDNGKCCNPAHMVPATRARNVSRHFAQHRTYEPSILRAFMDESGVTIKEVVKLTGRNESTVRRLMERGRATVNDELAVILASLMNVPVETIRAEYPRPDELRKTMCGKRLHSMLDAANVYVTKNGKRKCRACRTATHAAWVEANRDRWNAYCREYQKTDAVRAYRCEWEKRRRVERRNPTDAAIATKSIAGQESA